MRKLAHTATIKTCAEKKYKDMKHVEISTYNDAFALISKHISIKNYAFQSIDFSDMLKDAL